MAMFADNFIYDNDSNSDSDNDSSSSLSSLSSSSFTNPNPNRCLAICELHHVDMHGFTEESDELVTSHYLVIDHVDPHDCNEWNDLISIHQQKYRYYKMHKWRGDGLPQHPIVRNYSNIISHEKYVQPEIVERVYLRGSECVAIIKTFWLKIIQRAWKKTFSKRKQIEKLRFNPLNIRYWFTNGKWPESCSRLPDIHGLLVSPHY